MQYSQLPHRAQYSQLPHRARFGAPRPETLRDLALPPEPMPSHDGMRPLKAWRYVGVYGPELMLCLGAVRIGRARQSFWAVWDRAHGRLLERTTLGPGAVRLQRGVCRLRDRDVQLELRLDEEAGIETVCPTGASYGWTRKQGGVRAHGTAMIAGEPRTIDAYAVIDDSAAYYARHTQWHWSAGIGRATDGRAVAWNLVAGVNDPAQHSERTVWVDEEPFEAPPCTFDADLGGVDGLRFVAEATRERRENLLLVRSFYRQPFGTFSGELPGGLTLAEGYGVMEEHDVWW
jgi:Protein of unknown function (DUF2804)